MECAEFTKIEIGPPQLEQGLERYSCTRAEDISLTLVQLSSPPWMKKVLQFFLHLVFQPGAPTAVGRSDPPARLFPARLNNPIACDIGSLLHVPPGCCYRCCWCCSSPSPTTTTDQSIHRQRGQPRTPHGRHNRTHLTIPSNPPKKPSGVKPGKDGGDNHGGAEIGRRRHRPYSIFCWNERRKK